MALLAPASHKRWPVNSPGGAAGFPGTFIEMAQGKGWRGERGDAGMPVSAARGRYCDPNIGLQGWPRAWDRGPDIAIPISAARVPWPVEGSGEPAHVPGQPAESPGGAP